MGRIICMYSGRDGRSHFADAAMQLKPDGLGRISTGFLSARGWMYGVADQDRFVDWHTSGPGGVSVMLEGVMDVEVGSGETRRVGPGDMLIALDTEGQGHRSRIPAQSRGLSIAFDADPRSVMQALFGRCLDEAGAP